MLPERAIEGAKWSAPGRAMRGEEAIEGVSGPRQGHGVANHGHEGRLVEKEPRIGRHGVHELGVPHLEPPHLSEELHLEERHGGDTPGAVALQPSEFVQPGGSDHDPEEKVRIEEEVQERSSGTRSPSSPGQSHPQDGAFSASGTWIREA
jgi:hypothetical protein